MNKVSCLFPQNSVNTVKCSVEVPNSFNIVEIATQLSKKSVEALCRSILLAWNIYMREQESLLEIRVWYRTWQGGY